jgi:hypothetical protein
VPVVVIASGCCAPARDNNAQDAFEGRFASEDLQCLRTAVHVAEEMGEGLGAGQDMFGSL